MARASIIAADTAHCRTDGVRVHHCLRHRRPSDGRATQVGPVSRPPSHPTRLTASRSHKARVHHRTRHGGPSTARARQAGPHERPPPHSTRPTRDAGPKTLSPTPHLKGRPPLHGPRRARPPSFATPRGPRPNAARADCRSQEKALRREWPLSHLMRRARGHAGRNLHWSTAHAKGQIHDARVNHRT